MSLKKSLKICVNRFGPVLKILFIRHIGTKKISFKHFPFVEKNPFNSSKQCACAKYLKRLKNKNNNLNVEQGQSH